MPLPVAGDVHVNQPLSQISVAYAQQQSAFISTKVFPNIPVQKQSDVYWMYDKRYWLKSEAQKRAPGTESAGGGYRVGRSAYFAEVWAVHQDIPDQIRANTDSPLNADRDATRWVTTQMLYRREKEFANTFIKTGVWANEIDLNSGTKWDANGSDPITIVDEAMIAFSKNTGGLKPNVAIMDPTTESVLKNHSLILDRIKYTQRGIVTNDLIASLFGLRNLYTMSVSEYTGPEPNPNVDIYDPADVSATNAVNANMSFLAEDPDADTGKGFLLLLHVADSPSLMTPSAGYTFSWNGYLGASAEGGRIKRFRLEQYASDRIEMEMAFDMKVVCADMGTLITNIWT